jgi:hypothetical protein
VHVTGHSKRRQGREEAGSCGSPIENRLGTCVGSGQAALCTVCSVESVTTPDSRAPPRSPRARRARRRRQYIPHIRRVTQVAPTADTTLVNRKHTQRTTTMPPPIQTKDRIDDWAQWQWKYIKLAAIQAEILANDYTST